MGGTDKAFMRVGGRPVIDRSLTLLQEMFDEVILVTNSPDKYAGFWGVRVVTDIVPHMGPLAALFSGILHASSEQVFAVACDMPFLRREPIAFLQSVLAAADSVDAVVPIWDADVEPLHAFYRTRVAAVAERLLRRGNNGLRELLAAIKVRYVPEESLLRVPGAEETFRNVNTPADAARFAVEV
jgi:molybdopterin-guanine dinucleotide biosynthesis protein A